MSGLIPQSFIDELLTRVDIVEVVNQRVPLKKAGREYQACCPFHSEKTPSFTVSPSKQFYHCFGCGAHGTALGFVMEHDRLNFPEAIEELASAIGLDVPHEQGFDQGPDHRPLYAILDQAAQYYSTQLRSHPQAPTAANYLRGRGLNGDIAAQFRIGFAPPGWDNLLRQFGKDRAAIEQLNTAGLITEADDKRYDRLRDRIIFPIRDARGRVIGFGGRLLGDGKPKYLNSPETPLFHKGRELYGLYEARQALKQLPQILVVEGYMDVVALAQYGIRNAVATLGTATTIEHLEKLYRATPEVVFCFDGDRAGHDAAWKALDTALPLLRDGRQARFLFLPDGEDPDTLVRKIGSEAFSELITAADPLSQFLFDKLAEQVDMNSLDGRARMAELARPLLARLPSGTFASMMEQELARRIGLVLPPSTTPTAHPTPSYERRPRQARGQQPGTLPPVRRAVTLLLQHPQIAQNLDLPHGWEDLQQPGIELLRELIALLQTRPDLNTAALVEHWQDPKLRTYLAQLAVLRLIVQDDAAEQLIGALRALAEQKTRAERLTFHQKGRPSEWTEEEKQRLRELYRKRTDKPE